MLEVLRKRQGSTYGRYRLFFFGAKIHKIVGGEKEMEIKTHADLLACVFIGNPLLFYFVRERMVVPIVIRIGNP